MTIYRARARAAAGSLVLAVGAAACNTDTITNVNKNPNSPEDVPATTLFTNAARNATARWLGANYNLREASFVAQHMAEQQYPDEDRYARLGASDTEFNFDGAYPNELEDLTKVKTKGVAAKDAGVWAPAQILQTWDFSYLTNTFGDIPYFQALAGDSLGGTTTPAYDPQKSIYADLFVKLDAAGKALSGANASLGGADPIYGGNPAGWQAFANSLRARLAITLVNADAATTSTQLKAAIAAPGGLITTNAQNAQFAWPGDGIYNNQWSDFFKTRDDNRMSQTLINIMNASGDPRVGIYAQPLPGTTNVYAGMPNGLSAASASTYANTASRAGAALFPGATAYGFYGGSGSSFPSFIMTAAEVNFILAEAAQRSLGGVTPGQAAGYYNAGIMASMEQWGVTDQAAISAFLSGPNVAYQGGTAGLTQIAIQKWVALYTDGGEAWTEWRRTCQPATIKPGPSAANSTVPRRFMYSPTEIAVNGSAVQAAIANLGVNGDSFNGRMYWDTAPTAAPTYPGSACGAQ